MSSEVLPEHFPGLLVNGCTCEAVQEVPEVELRDSRKLVFIEHPWVPGAVLSTVPAVTRSVLRTALLCVTLPTLQMRKGGTERLVSCPKSHTQHMVSKNSNPGGPAPEVPDPHPFLLLTCPPASFQALYYSISGIHASSKLPTRNDLPANYLRDFSDAPGSSVSEPTQGAHISGSPGI